MLVHRVGSCFCFFSFSKTRASTSGCRFLCVFHSTEYPHLLLYRLLLVSTILHSFDYFGAVHYRFATTPKSSKSVHGNYINLGGNRQIRTTVCIVVCSLRV